MKILVVNIPTGEENGPFGDWARNVYVPFLKKNIDLVKAPGTEVTYRFADKGMGPLEMAFYRYLDHLAGEMVFKAAQNADKEGFDAVMIDCFGDPMLYELRQSLNIPVVGIGEGALLVATMMGWKFGMVNVSPYNIPEQQERVVKYGIADKCVGHVAVEGWEAGDDGDLVDASNKVERFIKSARKLIDMGAEVIVPACSITSPMVRFCPGAEDKYPNGITEIDGVPVLDSVGSAFKMAETLASLKNGGSSWISRVGQYAQPSDRVRKDAHEITDNTKYTFWDVV